MGGERTPGFGDDPLEEPVGFDDVDIPIGGGDAVPGPIGVDQGIELAGERIITEVIRDWDISAPVDTSDTVVINGATIADVAAALAPLPHWGKGGGAITNDAVPFGTSKEVTVTIHANLVRRMPKWADFDSATAKAKAEWNRMFAKLEAHEDKHVMNAVDEADKLCNALIGKEILKMPGMVTAANATLRATQIKMDKDTENGKKKGVPFGDVFLDTTVV